MSNHENGGNGNAASSGAQPPAAQGPSTAPQPGQPSQPGQLAAATPMPMPTGAYQYPLPSTSSFQPQPSYHPQPGYLPQPGYQSQPYGQPQSPPQAPFAQQAAGYPQPPQHAQPLPAPSAAKPWAAVQGDASVAASSKPSSHRRAKFVEDLDTCSICFNKVKEMRALVPCGHFPYCLKCVKKSSRTVYGAQSGIRCTNCRKVSLDTVPIRKVKKAD